nr:isoleucine--tRNA ligase [Patescibacteria group bacterium]
MFKEFDSVPNLPEQEKQTIEFWKQLDVVEKLKELRKDSPRKIYFDGPVTANNMPHYGHAITWTMKDIVPRYWSMQNYLVSRNMGWDCQGIPVEYEIEKQLGFTNKEDIEKYGVAKFNQLCRESVFKYRDSIFYYETRLGRWFDEKDMYYTMDAPFIESMWWSLKELYAKGLLYEGHKVVPYSTRAGTTLSSHEAAEGGYKELEDPFVTVKFPLKKNSKPTNTFLLAWTTTPWTLPGNLLLAIGKKIEYVKVEHNGDYYILAKERLEHVFADKPHKIVESLAAESLEGLEYVPPFEHYLAKSKEGAFKVVIADHANTDEGTGIVHLAPYGAEDFDVLMALNISLFDYLNETAHFTKEIPEYAGLFYKQANDKIIQDLTEKDRIFASGKLLHRMPMCWRTATPLIHKPVKSWYIKVTALKEKMLKENEKINWVPEHIKNGMAHQWLSKARDWAISRSRYWGTPLPLWVNDKTGEKVLVGSFAELKDLSGVELTDPHRPFVDDIIWEDKENGGTFRRVTDVIDVWYDSGSVPFAKLHYPFENADDPSLLTAEYISEGDDQVRLWFYTMHILGVALFGNVPYKNVVVTGMLNDKNDKKLSKSKKNYPPMDEVLDTFGGDVLRLFVLGSPVVQAESARFYEEALSDVKKEFFIPLWNSAKYFVTYANIHGFVPKNHGDLELHNELDAWILARLAEVINSVTASMDNYLIMDATRTFTPFVADLSTWYLRRSRERLRDGDAEALNTLYYVLSTFSRLLAPFVPFLSEELYQRLNVAQVSGVNSVHLDLYPQPVSISDTEKTLLGKMANTRAIVSAALSIRVLEKVKIRQPL